MRVLMLIVFSILFFGAEASAFELVNSNASVGPHTGAKLARFLAEIDSRLPPKMRDSLPSKLPLLFRHSDGASLEELCSGAKEVHVASLNINRLTGSIYSLGLNSLLLQAIDRGETIPCRHENAWRYALAAVLHELAHAFDLRNGHPSDSAEFKRAAGWSEGSFKNRRRSRLDTYEDTNLEEHFAVNMESFLLDPDYACRRPELHSYFSKLLENDPHPARNCQPERFVFLKGDIRTTRSLDPRKVSAVHYLHAGKGDAMVSRWGHALFRFVLCAGAADERACEADPKNNLILSYRGDVDLEKATFWAGMTGVYELVPMFYSLEQVQREYALEELRDLQSYKLALSPLEMAAIANRAAEQFWSYADRYRFLGSNCATESAHLLKSVLPFSHAFQGAGVSTPKDLLLALQNTGLAAAEGELWAESPRRVIESAMRELSAASGLSEDNFRVYLEKHRAEERRKNFPAAESGPARQKLAAAHFVLEKRALHAEKMRLLRELGDLPEFQLQPATGVAIADCIAPYGLPLEREFAAFLEQSRERLLADEDLAEEIWRRYAASRELSAEFLRIQENIAYLRGLLEPSGAVARRD